MFRVKLEGATQTIGVHAAFGATSDAQNVDNCTATSGGSNQATDVDSLAAHEIPFTAGRPSFEVLSGTIRLFREQDVSIEDALGRSRTLVIVAVPSHLSTSDLCAFLGAHLPSVEHLRVLRDPRHPGRYMVLLRMVSVESSEKLYKGYNGRPYSSFDVDMGSCHVMFVAEVRISPRITGSTTTPRSGDVGVDGAADGTAAPTPPSVDVNATATSSAAPPPLLLPSDPLFQAVDHHQQHGQIHQQQQQQQQIAGSVGGDARLGDATEQVEVCTTALTTQPAALTGASNASGGGGEAGEIGSGLIELPTCPVCLERLDSSASGMLTTLCNHTFHCTCFTGWDDGTCPVCRFVLSADMDDEDDGEGDAGGDGAAGDGAGASSRHTHHHSRSGPTCEVCGTRENLWLCLVCGHVGCGRYEREHALSHFQSSGHTYAIELSSQRVWDYCGDGYVHRLIQNKADGKLVELPDPRVLHWGNGGAGSSAGGYGAGAGGSGGGGTGTGTPASTPGAAGARSRSAPDTDAMLGDASRMMVSEKMDTIAFEYTLLLTHQLESQRAYFEGMLAQLLSLIPVEDEERRREAEALIYSQHGLARGHKLVHGDEGGLTGAAGAGSLSDHWLSKGAATATGSAGGARGAKSRSASMDVKSKTTAGGAGAGATSTSVSNAAGSVRAPSSASSSSSSPVRPKHSAAGGAAGVSESKSNVDTLPDDDVQEDNPGALRGQVASLQSQLRDLDARLHSTLTRAQAAEARAAGADKDRLAALRQVGALKDQVDNLSEEIAFLRDINDTQSRDVKEWQEAVKASEGREKAAVAAANAKVADLEAQVRDLCFALDTQARIAAAGADVAADVAGGHLLITDNGTGSGHGRGGGGTSVRARLAAKAAEKKSGHNTSGNSNSSGSNAAGSGAGSSSSAVDEAAAAAAAADAAAVALLRELDGPEGGGAGASIIKKDGNNKAKKGKGGKG